MPLYQRHGVWWVSVSHKGKRVRASAGAGATKPQAKEIQNKLYADIHAQRLGKAPIRSLDDALLRWLDNEYRSLKSPKKFESHARALLP